MPTLTEEEKLDRSIAKLQRAKAELEVEITALESRADYQKDYNKLIKEEIELKGKSLSARESELEAQKDLMDEIDKATDPAKWNAAERAAADLKDQIKFLKFEVESLNKANQGFDHMSKSLQLIVKTTLGIEKAQPGIISGFLDMAKGSEGLRGALAGVKKEMGEIFTAGNIVNSILYKIAQSTFKVYKETDKATSSLAAATGATSKYNSTLQNNWRGLLQYGLGVEDLGASMESLHANMLTSTELSEEQQKEFALTSAKLTKFGVSADTTSQLFDSLVQSMGHTSEEAADMGVGMFNLAQDLKMPPKMLIEGFVESSKYLSIYGKSATRIFKKVAAAAKATGIATGNLLDMTKQFNEYESAAQAAGSLNAMLGGDLVNSMELVSATDEERIAILQRVGAAAKQQFQGMSEANRRYQVLSLAGILKTDEATMMKMMNSSGNALEEFGKKAEESETDQQKFTKALSASTETMKKLDNVTKLLAAPLGRLMDIIDSFAQMFFKVDKATGKVTGEFNLFGEAVSGLLPIIAAFAIVAKVLLFTKAIAGVLGLGAAFGTVASGIGLLLGPITLVTTAGVALAIILGKIMNQFEWFGDKKDFSLGGIADAFINFGTGIGNVASKAGNFVSGNDVIMRPGEKPIMLNENDIVMAGTNLLGEKSRQYSSMSSNAANTRPQTPPSTLRDRDLVIKIDGREIGRIASEQMKKQYSYSYG